MNDELNPPQLPGFLTSLRGAELFFRVCRRYKITGYNERLAVLKRMAQRNKAKEERDVRPLIRGKKVLHIRPEPYIGPN